MAGGLSITDPTWPMLSGPGDGNTAASRNLWVWQSQCFAQVSQVWLAHLPGRVEVTSMELGDESDTVGHRWFVPVGGVGGSVGRWGAFNRG